MSLLLDALKKAAEKKAKLGASNKRVDVTEIDETAVDATMQQSTSIDTTLSTDPTETVRLEATKLDATELEETSIEATEVDATATGFSHDDTALAETTQELTSVEVTRLDPDDKTLLDEISEQNSNALDQTELDATSTLFDDQTNQLGAAQELDSTDVTQLDKPTGGSASKQNESELETGLEEPQIQETELDFTALDDTALDATELPESTQEMPVFKSTAADEHEPTAIDTTALDQTSVDSTSVDLTATSTLDLKQQDNTEQKIKAFDLTDSDHAEFDIEQDFNLDDDETTRIREDAAELNYFGLDSQTRSKMQQAGEKTFEIPALKVDPDAEELLTEEDVTEFMGDGVSDVKKKPFGAPVIRENPFSNDDTTLTNSDSLSLTNFGYEDLAIDFQDEDSSLILDETASDTDSLHGYPKPTPATQGLSLEPLPSDVSTRLAADSTSTTSSVDIDQLTNDETVTVEGKTSTRTFAPDNYDRTLLNMSDKDVSRIFPGMKPDSDAVMTPDYAKKVFLSRSGQQKTHYFKIYAGVGLLLLLLVILSGLFDLQDEADLIEQRVAGLKRDPMPGVIKSNTAATSTPLFAPIEENADIKALDVLATADREAHDLPQSDTPVSSAEADATQALEQKSDTAAAPKMVKADSAIPLKMQQELARPAEKMRSTEVKPAPVSKSSLQVSVKDQPDNKDQILNSAYQAYIAGDFESARAGYNKVLELDDTNRDGLLGRAAIHLQDNEYQLAIDKYQRILEQNPKDSMAMTALIAVANIQPQAGEAQLKNLIHEQPDSAYLYFALGNLYGAQSRWPEAQKAYFDALQYHPEEPNYAYNLAVSLEHIGKPAVAINYYQKALDNRSKGLATFNRELVVARIEVLTQ